MCARVEQFSDSRFSCTGTFEPTKTSFIARKQWIRKIDNRTEKKDLPKIFSLKDAEKAAKFGGKLFVTYVLRRRYFKCFAFKVFDAFGGKVFNRKIRRKIREKNFSFLPPANLWVWKNLPYCTTLLPILSGSTYSVVCKVLSIANLMCSFVTNLSVILWATKTIKIC